MERPMDLMELVGNVHTVVTTVGDIVGTINKFKGLAQSGKADARAFAAPAAGAPAMAQFQPQMRDPYGGGGQWLGQLQGVAAEHGNSWVPPQTAGLMGIDLTGVWSPPMNPMDQTYIRQYGPYLNVIAGIGGVPTFMAEGLFDPGSLVLRVVGRQSTGAPAEANAQLMPNWMMHGTMTGTNPWGMPMMVPLMMQRVA
jgi:hypothetical protein